MDKQSQFSGKTAEGVFCRPLFGSSGHFEKVGGAPPFADWSTGNDLRKVIGNITKQQRNDNAYVLVNALGAGEWFGANINSDWFGWDMLSHDGDDYGYKTFLNAHAFLHHVNKDPTRAFGKPIWSGINRDMKRVELIVELNRAKARLEGADGVITRVDAGEFPDVSMGTRVPYDICMICGHKSKTREDYCIHMRPPPELMHLYGPNKILPDGRRICVANPYAKFFDISFVYIGADKTAKVMAKLASSGIYVCLGDVCAIPRPSADVAEMVSKPVVPTEMAKTASVDCCNDCGTIKEAFSVKTSDQNKLSEILKEIPSSSGFGIRMSALESVEPNIPTIDLDQMARMPLRDVLSSLLSIGMVLKPHEFQRVILKSMGEDELANIFSTKNQVFKETSEPMDVPMSDLGSRIALPLMEGIIRARTAFGPAFKVRIVVGGNSNNSLPTQTQVEHPLLDKISSAYTGYRQTVLTKLAKAAQVVESDPQLRGMILGDGLVSLFSKTASSDPVVTLDSVTYLMGAYLKDRSLFTNNAVVEKISAANTQLLLKGQLA